MIDDSLVFYHSPRTRSSGTLTLLEELDAPYELRVLNFRTGEQRRSDYLDVNPLGKVPAIVHNGALVTEQGAIFIYLADAFPQKTFEPAIVDRFMKRDPAPASTSPYGDYDSVMNLIDAQLTVGPYLLGPRFTAADVLWGTALRWTVGFGLVTATPAIAAYIERVNGRDSVRRVAQTDEQLLKIHEAAAAQT